MKKLLIILFPLTLLLGCKSQELPEASLAVEAYIYTGKPVKDIKLSLVKPINGVDTQKPVSDAQVFIIWKGTYYPLVETSTPGSYEYLYGNLEIISENNYSLYIKYHEQDYYAETTVPKPPASTIQSKDTLHLLDANDFINISWQNVDSTWYLGVIAPGQPIQTDFPFNNFFSLPTQGNNLSITPEDINIIGEQQFVLYGITEDYEKLYRISNSSIGSSNVGNLSNGFGIFAAFSSDTLQFVAIDN